jgi:phage head maturation protease
MKKEIRNFDFEVRAEENERGKMLTGVPIVFDARTDLGWYDEIIEAGALDGTDLRDVRFLVNHNTDMIPLARSRNNNESSTMQMTVGEDGMTAEGFRHEVKAQRGAAVQHAFGGGDHVCAGEYRCGKGLGGFRIG